MISQTRSHPLPQNGPHGILKDEIGTKRLGNGMDRLMSTSPGRD